MQGLMWVALGGAIGSSARYGVGLGAGRMFGTGFPWGTLIVNVLGGLAMGLVSAFLLRKTPDAHHAQLFLATGVLGGFTTFSAYSLDVVNLMQRGETGTAAAYALGSMVLSVAAVFLGFAMTRVWT